MIQQLGQETTEEKKPFPIQVLGDRVMVLPVMEESDVVEVRNPDGQVTYKRRDSDILLSDKEVYDEKMKKQTTLARCLVISVGNLYHEVSADTAITTGLLSEPDISHLCIIEGDIVYCFPTTQDAKMTIDGVEYWIYKEKGIVAKEI